MDINVIFDASAADAPTGFEAVVEDVAQFYDDQFSNPITVNIHVGWGEVDGEAIEADALGESISKYTTTDYTYAQIKAALDASALTNLAQEAVATLPSADPTDGGEFTMTTAEAKALGLTGASGAVDGYVGFASTPGTFDFKITTNISNAAVPSKEYDLFTVVAHEFSEIMGRQMNFGISYGGAPGDGSGYDPLDLFDFSGDGARVFQNSQDEARYFSIDNGKTNLDNYNTDPSGDLWDWASAGPGVGDSYDAFATPGFTDTVSATDLTLMNVLGYQLSPDLFAGTEPVVAGPKYSFSIGNDSPITAPASTTGIYLSRTTTVTTADTLLADYATPAISTGGKVNASVILSIPVSLAEGMYYLAAIADANGALTDSDPSNNVSPTIPIAVLHGDYPTEISIIKAEAAFVVRTLTVSLRDGSSAAFIVSAPIVGKGSLELEALWLEPGARLTIAKLSLGGPVNVDTSVDYAGTLTASDANMTVAAADTLTLSGADEFGYPGAIAGAGAINFKGGSDTFNYATSLTIAKIEVSGASVIADASLAYAGDWDQTAGTISAGYASNTVTLTGAGDAFSGALTGAGDFDITGAGDTFKNVTLSAASTKIDAASVNLAGTIDIAGVVDLTSAAVNVAAGITRLTGGGTLEFADVASDEVIGGADPTLLENVSDKITGAGVLGGGALRLDNEAGGIIDGNQGHALTIDTPAGAVINAGVIEAVGAGGVTIAGAVSNSGTLAVLGGDLTVDGAVTGAGEARISGGAVKFDSTFAQNVVFTATGGELELADAAGFAGTISGFSKTGASSLDLEDIDFAGASESYSGTTTSGVLTVTDGTHTAKIKLTGNYLASTWTLSSDDTGGTLVADPTPARAAALTSALASFAPAPTAGARSFAPPAAHFTPSLAHPATA
jgi:hypothetical protein